MEILFWTLYSVTPKYLDCMQYYTMLLEQFYQIVAKDLATAIWLDEDQPLLAWSRDWTAFLPLHKTLSTLHFELCQLLKQYVFDCTRYRVNWEKHN